MSALRDAVDALTTAIHHLERAEQTVPAYATDSLHFLRAELKVCRRRIENVRRTVNDLDAEPPGAT